MAGECKECKGKKLSVQRRDTGQTESLSAPPIVREVLRSPGQPLDAAARSFMEARFYRTLGRLNVSHAEPSLSQVRLDVNRPGDSLEQEADHIAEQVMRPSPEGAPAKANFGFDFRRVRIHTGPRAAESAQAVNALAYTVGPHIVFGAGSYAPGTRSGLKLLAHEMTHVVQQSGGHAQGARLSRSPLAVQRVCPTPYTAPSQPGFRVCSRPALGFNHSYIEASPFRYGLMERCENTRGPIPLLTGADLGLPGNPTAARASDRSPDPCNNSPRCVACTPKPGVTNLDSCFRQAFSAYPEPSEYVISGPNSNTFGGTLARACCDGMETEPAALGSMPGWGHSIPSRVPDAVCRSGPCCDDPPRGLGERIGRGLRGAVAVGLQGLLAGAAAGALIGGLVGLIPGVGLLAGLGAGALIGGAIGGGLGAAIGLIAGLIK